MPKPDNVNGYKDLETLALPKLRELCAADTKIANTTAPDRAELLDSLAEAYGFERPKLVKAAGISKLKIEVQQVKKQRDEILAAKVADRDKKQLDQTRTKIKRLKREMRRLAEAR